MDEIQQSPYRHNDLRARRTPSKIVSDAFSFLNNKTYSDKDGVVRIHSSYSDSSLAYMDRTDSSIGNLATDVYIPEDTEEFTIVTSVEKSPLPQHKPFQDGINGDANNFYNSQPVLNHNASQIDAKRESLPIIFTAETGISSGLENNRTHSAIVKKSAIERAVNTNDKDKYTIVTYLEDFNKPGSKKTSCTSDTIGQTVNVNNTFDPNKDSVSKDNDHIKHEIAEPVVDKTEEKRRSVNIEGEVVELRSPDRNSKPPRTQTWKENQELVSEAFHFLQDLEGGDTMSVISVPVADKSDKNLDSKRDGGMKFIHENEKSNTTIIISGKRDVKDNQVNRNEIVKNLSMNHVKDRVQNGPTKTATSLNSFGKSADLSSFGRSVSVPENRISSDLDSAPNSSQRNSTSSEKEDQLGELGVSRLRQRKKSQRKESDDDDDGDSSDEDRGVYRESFRKSTWLYVGDSSDFSTQGGNSKELGFVSLADLDNIKSCDSDSVFGDDSASLPSNSPSVKKSHMRNDSVSTTASEKEFRNAYSHVSKRVVKRADSELEYKRFSSKFYDHEKVFTIEKGSDSGYGIHIIDSHPAVITQVEEDSPGARAGVQEGQIVISINNVNVLEHEHDEIIKLVQENSTQLVLEVGCSDVAHIRDLEIPMMTGYLMKQTSAKIFKSWKRRYFILRRDNCLYYYKSEKDSDPLGAIPLMGYTVSRHGDHNKFAFKAEKFDNRTFYFMADTRDEMAKWVGAMNEAALRSKHKKDTWLDVTTNNVGLPALEIRKPDCSGYLFKMGRVTKRWKRHYCVLKDACIYHYKNSSSKEAIGVAHLHGYTVDPEAIPGKKLSFCLLPPDPQMRSFSFYSDNETDKRRWVAALQTSIQKWVKVG